MKVPKEIADMVLEYQKAREEAAAARKVIVDWLEENTDARDVYIDEIFLADEPTGQKQDDGEYCDQTTLAWSEDSFEGTYYHQIEGSSKYLGYGYSC